MNFYWFLLLGSSEDNSDHGKSDTRTTNIHQAFQQRKCTQSKKQGNKRGIATGRGGNPSNQQITSSKFIPCSLQWLNKDAKKTRFDEACGLIKCLRRFRKQCVQSIWCSFVIQNMELMEATLLSHGWQGIYHFAYILRPNDYSSIPLLCQHFQVREEFRHHFVFDCYIPPVEVDQNRKTTH